MRHPLAHSVLIVLLSALPFRAEKAPPLAAAQIELSFAPIVKTTAPGVVNIYASRIVAQHASLFAADPFYPANYGNALLDMAEELVGINTSILTRSGGSDGIGFAIPANLVGQYIDQARAGHTSFHSPWAGIAVQQVEASIAQAIGEMAPRGVVITNIHPEGPFAKAGLDRGDVILSIGGASVDAPPDLDFRLATLGLGRKIPLTWLRDGRLRPSEIPLTEAPDDPPANTLRLSTRNLFDGPTVATINPRLPETYNLPLDAAGVVVVGMQGYPRNSGTQLGDILSVGDRQIRNSSDLAHATSGGPANWDITPGRGPLALRRRLRG